MTTAVDIVPQRFQLPDGVVDDDLVVVVGPECDGVAVLSLETPDMNPGLASARALISSSRATSGSERPLTAAADDVIKITMRYKTSRSTARTHAVLTKRERQIMDVLYRLGRATAGDVRLNLDGSPSDWTVRTQLRVLEAKGHVRHEEEGLRFVFMPTVPRVSARRSALKHLVDTFFDGSSAARSPPCSAARRPACRTRNSNASPSSYAAPSRKRDDPTARHVARDIIHRPRRPVSSSLLRNR